MPLTIRDTTRVTKTATIPQSRGGLGVLHGSGLRVC